MEIWSAIPKIHNSGKSTILKEMFPRAVKYSLKDVSVRRFALNDPVAFLNQTREMIFIDEVQKAPELLEYIQGIVDNNADRRFLLSGSSNFELMSSLTESLAGRAGVFELMPMAINEIRDKLFETPLMSRHTLKMRGNIFENLVVMEVVKHRDI